MAFLPHSEADLHEMLAAAGVSSVEELYADIPDSVRLGRTLDMPAPQSEAEAARTLGGLAAENASLLSFAGAGLYEHYVPAAVDHLVRRSEYYTAYTPYQPEVAQGTLQVIYEFQTMVCELTGMDVANASMYDGASATAEAALMALSVSRRDKLVIAGSLHPHYRRVLDTYVVGQECEIVTIPVGDDGRLGPADVATALDDRTAALFVQSPNFLGAIEDLAPLADAAHEQGALFVTAVADALSLALLKPPGACGADIVTAEGQPFGNAMSFGGPVCGLFAASQKLIRKMPGRIVGATVDMEDRRGYVLTLQTREQQIRREKATSNICTNQGLNALAVTIHLALLGKDGLREVAETSVQNAHYARRRLEEAGLELLFPDAPFFREFAIATPGTSSRDLVERGIEEGLLPGVALGRLPEHLRPGDRDGLLLAFTEVHRQTDIERLAGFLADEVSG